MNILEAVAQPQTIVLTGAAGGMGLACCQYLSELGWYVLAIDHNAERLSLLHDKVRVEPLMIDLHDEQLVSAVLAALKTLPPIWGLVNLAGISRGDRLDKLTLADWKLSFDVNVTPAFLLTQALAPLMAENGGGSIVNVSSPVGMIGAKKPSYAASKAALQGLTASCARALGADNIRVNLLLPGTTITEMTKDWSEERQAMIAEQTLLKRLCTPKEIAQTIAFLLSQHSSYLSGSIVDMTCGGMWGH